MSVVYLKFSRTFFLKGNICGGGPREEELAEGGSGRGHFTDTVKDQPGSL